VNKTKQDKRRVEKLYHKVSAKDIRKIAEASNKINQINGRNQTTQFQLDLQRAQHVSVLASLALKAGVALAD
jgi:hypothetical protein